MPLFVLVLVMLHTIPPWKWLFAILVPFFMALDAVKKKKLNRKAAIAGDKIFVGLYIHNTLWTDFTKVKT